jgi:divinyl protochlorophyllide a 8-vinyl-reductase
MARAGAAPPIMPGEAQAAAAGPPLAVQATARMGPNAITRLAQAVERLYGPQATRRLFDAAGQAHHLVAPPHTMVDERDVIALHRSGRSQLGLAAFARVAGLAGRLTGDYLLAHRIPRLAQRLLVRLPSGLAARLLVRAIAAHAWTFAGSGSFAYRHQRGGLLLTIDDSPLARAAQAPAPLCGYYAATIESIFQALIDQRVTVVETTCAAMGEGACTFEVRR